MASMSAEADMVAHFQRREIPQAIEAGERAYREGVAAWGEHDLRVAQISHNLGEALLLGKRFGDALAAAKHALAVREELLDAYDARLANTLETIAKIQE